MLEAAPEFKEINSKYLDAVIKYAIWPSITNLFVYIPFPTLTQFKLCLRRPGWRRITPSACPAWRPSARSWSRATRKTWSSWPIGRATWTSSWTSCRWSTRSSTYTYSHRDRSIDGAIPFIMCMLIVILGTYGGVFSQEKPSARRTTRQEAAVTQTVVIPLTVVVLLVLLWMCILLPFCHAVFSMFASPQRKVHAVKGWRSIMYWCFE